MRCVDVDRRQDRCSRVTLHGYDLRAYKLVTTCISRSIARSPRLRHLSTGELADFTSNMASAAVPPWADRERPCAPGSARLKL